MDAIQRIKKRVKKDGIPVTFYLGCTVIASKLKKDNKDKMYQNWIDEYESDIPLSFRYIM